MINGEKGKVVLSILIFIFVAGSFGVGRWFIQPYQSGKDILENTTYDIQSVDGDAYLIDKICNRTQCLIKTSVFNENLEGSVFGVASIRGVVKTISRTFVNDKEYQCAVLKVQGGPEDLVKDFIGIAQTGNAINSITESGELVLLLGEVDDNWDYPVSGQVEAIILRKSPEPKSGGPCTSFVSVIDIEQI